MPITEKSAKKHLFFGLLYANLPLYDRIEQKIFFFFFPNPMMNNIFKFSFPKIGGVARIPKNETISNRSGIFIFFFLRAFLNPDWVSHELQCNANCIPFQNHHSLLQRSPPFHSPNAIVMIPATRKQLNLSQERDDRLHSSEKFLRGSKKKNPINF